MSSKKMIYDSFHIANSSSRVEILTDQRIKNDNCGPDFKNVTVELYAYTYSPGEYTYDLPWDNPPLMTKLEAKRVFIGKNPQFFPNIKGKPSKFINAEHEDYEYYDNGNSILLDMGRNVYILLKETYVYMFCALSKIETYVSFHYRDDVTPYAIDKLGNCYLFNVNVIIPFPENMDPYDYIHATCMEYAIKPVGTLSNGIPKSSKRCKGKKIRVTESTYLDMEILHSCIGETEASVCTKIFTKKD